MGSKQDLDMLKIKSQAEKENILVFFLYGSFIFADSFNQHDLSFRLPQMFFVLQLLFFKAAKEDTSLSGTYRGINTVM